MEKHEFLEALEEKLSGIAGITEVGVDDPPYSLMAMDEHGSIFRLQVTESRASGTRATALQAGNVIAYINEHPQADSKEVASACDVTVSYVDILKSALKADKAVKAAAEVESGSTTGGNGGSGSRRRT